MIKERSEPGKAAEELFLKYRIFDRLNRYSHNDKLEYVNVADTWAWRNVADIDAIVKRNGIPEFHEIKEQLSQYIDHYNNTTVEHIQTTKYWDSVERKWKGFVCQEDISKTKVQDRTLCEDCARLKTCNGYEIIKAPNEAEDYLYLRGQWGNYRPEYYVKFGDGWINKNHYLHADWYHFLFALEYEPNEESKRKGKKTRHESVRHESPENIERLRKMLDISKNEKIITRFPFDFFLSIKHNRLIKLLEEYADTAKARLFQLPIVDVISKSIWTFNDFTAEDEIVYTPIISCIGANDTVEHDEIVGENHNYIIRDSLMQESGFNYGGENLSEEEKSHSRDIAIPNVSTFWSKYRKDDKEKNIIEPPAALYGYSLQHHSIRRIFDL